MTLNDLCTALLNAASVEDIENVLQRLRTTPPGSVKWVPVGRENNRGTIESSADPGRSLVERVTNGIDAILEDEWVTHRGRPDCKSPREAASAWLDVPVEGLSRMSTRQRQALAERVRVMVEPGGGKHLRTITTRDFGVGIAPAEMPQTILSLSESNKVQKMHLAGAYGQGGSSTFAVSRFSVIASRKAGTDTLGVTLVRYEDLPAELFKHGRYVYLTIDNAIPGTAAPQEFPSGTLVRHVGYDLTSYPSPVGPNSVYGLLNRTLFDPIIAVWFEDRVHDYRRVIKGSRNALNGAVDEGDTNTRGPQLDHHMALYYVDFGHFGRIGIEYWVLEAPDNANKRPTAAFVNPSKPIVLSVHGQSHAELPLSIVRKEAQLPYLAMRLIVHVDCNGLTPSAKRSLFVSNREEARTGQVYERIEQEVIRALTSDDELARLNQAARERGLHERDEETEQEMRLEVARLFRIQGLDMLDAIGGVATESLFETGDRPPTSPRPPRPPLPPIQINDPPTFIRFVGELARLYPEQRRYVRVETDAPPEYHIPDNPMRSRLNIIVNGDGVRIAGSTPLQGGRMRIICEALSSARLGTRGHLRLELSRPGQSALVAEQPFDIVERPPTRPGERRMTLPRFRVVPVVGPQDEMWITLGWSEDIAQVASSAEMAEGQLTIYYSMAFPKFQTHYGRFERQDPALAQSFVKRYEIWLAVHSLLLYQDQQMATSTSAALGHGASSVPEEALDALERQERCRLATQCRPCSQCVKFEQHKKLSQRIFESRGCMYYSGPAEFPPFGVLPPAATQGDRYIWSVIAKYRPSPASVAMVDQAQAGLTPHIRAWAGQCLVSLFRSGSFAKGTTIRGDSDLDLLISLRSDTQGTMAEVYSSLGRFLSARGYEVRYQNVSVRVVSAGLNVDVTPAKRQPGVGYDHTLYRSKARTWTKTNVHRHIQLIKTCRRIPEIRAMKIWRSVHGLDFPSFHLELVVLEALRGHAFGRLEANVLSALEFLSNRLIHCRIDDPSNMANILSDKLTVAEKQAVANQADRSLAEGYWERIIW